MNLKRTKLATDAGFALSHLICSQKMSAPEKLIYQCDFIEFRVKYMFIFLNKIYKTQKKLHNFKNGDGYNVFMFKETRKSVAQIPFYLNPQQILWHIRQQCNTTWKAIHTSQALIH